MTGDSESSRRAELEKIAGEMPDQYRAMILLASWCALRFGELNELRSVEGASHMAEGYTRAKAGNIGICVGTSGPAGTDMITGLHSTSADSIPILAITGHAPVARLHKEDFQAVDIAAIAAPVTKMARCSSRPRCRGRSPRHST
jgi:glyoxylate carboligase